MDSDPAVGPVDAGEHLAQRAFARAVFAHQPVAFAPGDVERNIPQCRDAAERSS